MFRKLALVLGLLVSAVSWADVIVLKDGTRLEGSVKRTDAGWTITTGDGKTQTVPADAVKSIQLGTGTVDAHQAAEGLASLRRSVLALSDVNQIIDRYQRFIDNAKDADVVEQAQQDLAMWKDRSDRGLVKRGSKWVAPEELPALAAQGNALAQEARRLMRQGRNRDAEQILLQAMDADPQNTAAQYLRGVLLYRQDKLADARKAFEAVNAVLPEHAPTLNNLAGVLWRQNAQGAALNYYDQAMQASPVNKYILDNVAEALGVISDDQRKTGAAAKASRRFIEQDNILQQQLAQQGLYRWGSSWVNQKTLDELKAAEKQVYEKLDALQAQFDQAKARITAIDRQIEDNERLMRDYEARSLYRDKDGNIVRLPLPLAYYDLRNDNARLRSEQASLRASLDTTRETAKRVRQQMPVPKFTGVQQIVGVEGAPLPEDQNPTTQPIPSTEPS